MSSGSHFRVSMTLSFRKIVRHNIFSPEFADLQSENIVEFPMSGIAVVYGPNGIGKSSLAAVLAREAGSAYKVILDETEVTSEGEYNPFHVINDQNGRNVIQGSTEDFILGDNIRREYELKNTIDTGFYELFNDYLATKLKTDYGISKKAARLISYVEHEKIREYVSDLANNRSKGSQIDRAEFLGTISAVRPTEPVDHDEAKLSFVIRDLGNQQSVIAALVDTLDKSITLGTAVARVEETSDAVALLRKYDYLSECIVCDTPIDRLSLLERKEADRVKYVGSLDDNVKAMLEVVRKQLMADDPFEIKRIISECARLDTVEPLSELVAELKEYANIAGQNVIDLFAECLEGRKLSSAFKEYETIVQEKPALTDEDVLFIERFVNDCIDKQIELRRDENNNLELLLGDRPFLNKERSELRLSNGEQNFISIAFELLKAKKVDAPIIVLDDPISSFDSIFKNKIIYAISKFLEGKSQILLTHNTDLVKLLEHQKSGSFNLYILNNTNGEQNGFFPINHNEQGLLLYLSRVVEFLRNDAPSYVKREREFLISLAPFMRSFAHIAGRQDIKNNLTSIMHGFGDATVNLSDVYRELFDTGGFPQKCVLSVDDIIAMEPDATEIVDPIEYPLLNRSLRHVFTYLWLRLRVEDTLARKFDINFRKHDQLTRIINKAFNGSGDSDIGHRVFLLSRKSLLNEFNHFEQDLNLFQPALDITDTALRKEKHDILAFLSEIEESA